MTNVVRGTSATLTASFLEYAGGPAAGVSGGTVRIATVSGTVVVATTSTGVTNPATGLLVYVWAVPADQALGDYLVTWTATDGDGDLVSASEVISVISSVVSSSSWATTADVLAITGATVSDTVVSQAQAIVEMFVGRTYDATARTSTRDVAWLRRAVAYQAAWMPSQPDLYGRLDLVDTPDTGQLKERALVLAPMASWALKRVSLLRNRSVHIRPAGPEVASLDFVMEASDESHGWIPMGSI